MSTGSGAVDGGLSVIDPVRQTSPLERARYRLGGWLLRPYLDAERRHYEALAKRHGYETAAYYDGVAAGLAYAAHPNRTWTHRERSET